MLALRLMSSRLRGQLLGPGLVVSGSALVTWLVRDELTWGFALSLLLVPIGLIAGSMAFLQDLQRGGVHFMETLPVRRSDVWWAAYLEGLAVVLGCAAASIAVVVATSASARPGRAPGLELALGALGPGLAVFALTVLGRTWTLSAAALYGPVIAIGGVFAFVFLMADTDLKPSPVELFSIFVVLAVLSSASSLYLSLRWPPNRSRDHQRIFGWSLAVALVCAAAALLVWIFGLRWMRLGVDEVVTAEDASVARDGSVIARVVGRRSGQHLLRIAPSGSVEDLGRGLEARGDAPDELYFIGAVAPGGVFELQRRTYAYALPGGPLAAVPGSGAGMVSVGERFVARWEGSVDAPLVVVDRRTGRERTVEVPEGVRGFGMSAGGRVLASAGSGLLLHDAASGTTRRIAAGSLLAVDPEAHRALIADRSLSFLDLDTGASRVLIGEDHPLSRALSRAEDTRWYASVELRGSPFGALLGAQVPPGIGFDAELRRVVAVIRSRDGDSAGFSLHVLDVDTGEHREVIGADRLPRFDLDEAPRARVLSVSADGTKAGLEIGRWVVGVDLAKGSAWRATLRGDTSIEIGFSPSYTRASYHTWGATLDGPLVLDASGTRELSGLSGARFTGWLDDDHALVVSGAHVLSVDVASGVARTLY